MEIETMPAAKLSAEATERKVKRNVRYNADSTKLLTIRLNYKTDADLFAYLETINNKQGLVKELLRSRMKEEGFVYGEEA